MYGNKKVKKMAIASYHAKALAHQRRADEYRRMAFGAGSPGHGFAVNKDGDELTFNMKEICNLKTNGDYRLVHSYDLPNQSLDQARNIVNTFNTDSSINADYLKSSPHGSIQRALAELYKKDPIHINILLANL
jgi:hypothetical protein